MPLIVYTIKIRVREQLIHKIHAVVIKDSQLCGSEGGLPDAGRRESDLAAADIFVGEAAENGEYSAS
jgi:hypothetical protein